MNKSNIGIIVGKYFIRMCKNNDIYHVFKHQFDTTKNHKTFNTPYKNNAAKNIEEMFNAVGQKSIENVRNTNDKYEIITIVINTLLQFYLEKGGIHPSKLGMIGQQIFNLSAYAIYGEEFLIDMQKEMQDTGIESPKNDFEVFCLSQYQHLKRENNEIGSFNSFMSQYKNQLKRAFNDYMKNH